VVEQITPVPSAMGVDVNAMFDAMAMLDGQEDDGAAAVMRQTYLRVPHSPALGEQESLAVGLQTDLSTRERRSTRPGWRVLPAVIPCEEQ
jgi:hypothetical protein